MNEVLQPGVGLDIGTGFLVACRMNPEGKVETKSVRDAFLELSPKGDLVFKMMKKGLQKSGVSFIEDNKKLHILGDDSLSVSVEKQMITRRPMQKGVISPREAKALPMFKVLLAELLGPPKTANEKIVYSIPASPSDAPFDVEYHTSVIEKILSDLGYSGKPINEAQAIAFSELEDDDYTGISISCGAGMTNVCISNMAEVVTTFAVSRGGDYIDYSAATSLGYDPKDEKVSEITPSLITYVKEQGIDISSPGDEVMNIAIASYYNALIRYIVKSVVNEISKLESKPKFLSPVPIVVSGGTSLAKGFLEAIKVELKANEDQLPFKIGEIRAAKNPLTAVAEGAFIALAVEGE
jgi:hypothetical protein